MTVRLALQQAAQPVLGRHHVLGARDELRQQLVELAVPRPLPAASVMRTPLPTLPHP